MLRSMLRDELKLLLRHEILDLDEVRRAIAIGRDASFLDRVPVIESSVGDRDAGAFDDGADGADSHAAIPVEAGA
jgi:hypothetical protein